MGPIALAPPPWSCLWYLISWAHKHTGLGVRPHAAPKAALSLKRAVECAVGWLQACCSRAAAAVTNLGSNVEQIWCPSSPPVLHWNATRPPYSAFACTCEAGLGCELCAIDRRRPAAAQSAALDRHFLSLVNCMRLCHCFSWAPHRVRYLRARLPGRHRRPTGILHTQMREGRCLLGVLALALASIRWHAMAGGTAPTTFFVSTRFV